MTVFRLCYWPRALPLQYEWGGSETRPTRKLSVRKLRNKFRVTLRVKGVARSWMLVSEF